MNEAFAEALRRKRTEKNLSQQQLANKLYVDRSAVAGWETGRRVPSAAMIPRIAACLDLDVAELLLTAEEADEKPDVILVDDEKIVLTGGIPILEQVMPNAVITGFTRPSDALRFAESNRIALALLDIEMGKQSGFELCRKLLQIHARTNVVFLTAYMDYSFDAWSTGACGFLLKPLSAAAVQKQLTMLRFPVRGLS